MIEVLTHVGNADPTYLCHVNSPEQLTLLIGLAQDSGAVDSDGEGAEFIGGRFSAGTFVLLFG